MPSAYSVRRPVVNAYLVRERDRRRARELAWVVATVLPLGLGLAGYTWLQLETLRVAYRTEALEREAHHLAQVERQLRLGLAGYTWLQLETLRVAYRTEALEREAHQLTQVERQLRLEAAYLSNPERVAERARAELGLDEPRIDQVLFLEETRP